MTYHYFGLLFGKLKASVAILSVVTTLTGGTIAQRDHAAVWLGASSPDARRWVQAGVEQSGPAGRLHEYIEVKRASGITLRTWRVAYGHVAHVRLAHSGSRWRVFVDGHSSSWVNVPRARTVTTLETYSSGRLLVAATIDDESISTAVSVPWPGGSIGSPPRTRRSPPNG